MFITISVLGSAAVKDRSKVTHNNRLEISAVVEADAGGFSCNADGTKRTHTLVVVSGEKRSFYLLINVDTEWFTTLRHFIIFFIIHRIVQCRNSTGYKKNSQGSMHFKPPEAQTTIIILHYILQIYKPNTVYTHALRHAVYL